VNTHPPEHAHTERTTYFKGLTIATIGVIVLSFDALLIRLSGVGGFQASFWRALFTGISLTIVFFGKNRKSAKTMLVSGGRTMWTSGILWGLSGLGFTLGVQTAGAANTLVLLGLAPLFAAAFGFIAYRQKPSFVTLLATLGTFGGIYYMYRNGFGSASLTGMLFAISTPTLLGINLAFLRRHQAMSRVAVSMIGGYVGALISLVVTAGKVAIPTESLLPLLILGLFAIPFSQTMISTGTRYIPAAESALVNSLETVLGITYVWTILGEAPTIDFIIGAAIVMVSITANSLYQARIRNNRLIRNRFSDGTGSRPLEPV
jgi:drug/metabolite transporter (DMT)-like permease